MHTVLSRLGGASRNLTSSPKRTRVGATRRTNVRSVVSLALVTSLSASALPVVAEQNTPMNGPIARSVTGEVARLVTTEQRASDDSEWSRVRRLAPGTELIVIVKNSQPASRYFVGGDESGLTMLNIDASALPTDARNVLRSLASTHPEYFLAAQKGGQFQLETNVRLGPDGVFIADRKVAGLAEVVEQRGRQDITEMRTGEVRSNSVGCALCWCIGWGSVGGVVLGR